MPKQKPANQQAEVREVLDSETLAALEQGIRSEQTGKDYTWDEVKQFARERRQTWMTIPNSLNS